MIRGFHSLTSGMLTQSRVLDTISNNMANSSTPGFKSDTVVSTSFAEELMARLPNTRTENGVPIGTSSPIRYVSDVLTDFTQSFSEQTARPLDFALSGDGFFTLQTQEGIVYTRNGSFTIDDEGFLSLPNMGRVMGQNGAIELTTDDFTADQEGNITINGALVDTLEITTFVDNNLLVKGDEGIYTNADAANINANPEEPALVMWQSLERSNVSAMDEIVAMMESQRALQSSSQMIKIYDELMAKMVTEIGRV